LYNVDDVVTCKLDTEMILLVGSNAEFTDELQMKQTLTDTHKEI
jgi:hypothetical protein